MVPVLEAVPNLSEGRDPAFVQAAADVVTRHGVDVFDASSDPDHHRSVLTYAGAPDDVEEASVALARLAVERIDLREHRGVHPRVGALDVLPFVPLSGLTMADAVAVAHRVGRRIARELGVPVVWYGAASDPPGRGLAELRRGGVEALWPRFPDDRRPDLDAGRAGAHPTAGLTCVGARPVLLAWNLVVEGVAEADVRAVAAALRERGGGFQGLRALGLRLGEADSLQLSMNLEDVEHHAPAAVFDAAEAALAERGGRVVATEVIGMIPSALVLDAAARRLRLLDPAPARFLPDRLARHVSERVERDLGTISEWVARSGDLVPPAVRAALARLEGRPAPASERPRPGDPE